jgi:hypothetical protein
MEMMVCTAGCADCSCRCPGREIFRRLEPRSVPQLPLLQLRPLLALCSLCCRPQTQLPSGGESRLVPQLPLLQSLRAARSGSVRAEVQRRQTAPCRGERRCLLQLPVLSLMQDGAGPG